MWTEECPTSPGEYWFYGWSSQHQRDREYDPILRWLSVRQGKSCLVYYNISEFMSPEHMTGWFCEADIPALPIPGEIRR